MCIRDSDSLCQAPDCLSKPQIPNPRSRISEQFFQDFGAISQHPGPSSQQSGALGEQDGAPPLRSVGPNAGFALSGAKTPPLTPFKPGRLQVLCSCCALRLQNCLHCMNDIRVPPYCVSRHHVWNGHHRQRANGYVLMGMRILRIQAKNGSEWLGEWLRRLFGGS